MTDYEGPFAWASQVRQYPATGPAGIGYFRGDLSGTRGRGVYVDCLLYRDEDGVVVGILNHFPQDIPPYERQGSMTVRVREDRRRRGIGSALVHEALTRWVLKLYAQSFTRAGMALGRAVIEDLQRNLAEEERPRGETN